MLHLSIVPFCHRLVNGLGHMGQGLTMRETVSKIGTDLFPVSGHFLFASNNNIVICSDVVKHAQNTRNFLSREGRWIANRRLAGRIAKDESKGLGQLPGEN